MHYFQKNIADWAMATAHLSLEEEAVYSRLIDFYYDNEGPIPENPEETRLALRKLRLQNYQKIVKLILPQYLIFTS